MKLRNVLFTILLLFIWGVTYSRPSDSRETDEQIGYAEMNLKYGLSYYNYTFSIRNGLVTWKYSGPDGNGNGHFRCNREVSGETISALCQGVVYWSFAGTFIWQMVEKKGEYDGLLYKRAMSALESSMSELERGKKTSPEAYERVRQTYMEIKEAEDGKSTSSLWDTLVFFSYAMNEHELKVSDLYNYDF